MGSLVDLQISYYVNTITNFCLGFTMMGMVETVSIFLIVLYICTKTRASSILIQVASEWIPVNRFDITPSSVYNQQEEKPSVAKNYQNQGVQDLLRVTQHAGRKIYGSLFDWGMYFPYLAQCVRLKKYSYPQVSDAVLKDPKLQRAIRQAAEDILKQTDDKSDSNYQKILKAQEKRAKLILIDMRSKISDLMLRITSWLLYKLLPWFLSGVVTHAKQIEMLKEANEKSDVPLIFLPLHRSHLDYIMVSFILLNNDIRSPIVAAGNNLQIPVFGSLLRGLGAFFIKRKIDPVVGKKDILYRAILHLYLEHALGAGHNLEFFIEGGRTRTGKPCMPKNGILSVIVSAFMDGTISDALLVPVSVNYERLVDGNFVREQLGRKKQPETFRSAISGIYKALNSKYGLMRIDFNQPFSLKELVQSYNKIAKEEGSSRIYKPAVRQLQHIQSTSSLYGTDVVCEEHRSLVNSISRQVIYDCAEATSVMSTNALAFLLLTRFREGAFEEDIAKELDNLRNTLAKQKDIAFVGKSLHIIRYATDLLGSELISREKLEKRWFIKPINEIPKFIELSYYSNTVALHFALESIVITSIYSLLQDNNKKIGVSLVKLKEACLEHCEILRYEFILNKPTQNLEKRIEDAIDSLCYRNILTHSKDKETQISYADPKHKRLANYVKSVFDDIEDDDYGYSESNTNGDSEDIFLSENKKSDQNALFAVLSPIGHTYLAVVHTLKKLLSGSMLESDFISSALQEINQNIENGDCKYGESISTDSIRNCLKLLEKWSVIEFYNQHGVKLLSLGSLYDTLYGVQNIIDRIQCVVPKEI